MKKLAKFILLFAMLNLTGCATTGSNDTNVALQQREAKTQNLDQQEAASMAATTIAPVTSY